MSQIRTPFLYNLNIKSFIVCIFCGLTFLNLSGVYGELEESLDLVGLEEGIENGTMTEDRAFFPAGTVGHDTMHNSMINLPKLNLTDYNHLATMILTHIPMFKMNFYGHLMRMILPSLHVVLILSLILFTLAGTVAIACSALDCSGGFGLINSQQQHHHRPYYNSHNFLKKNFRNLNNNSNGGQYSYYNQQTKPWSLQDPVHNQVAQNLDESFEKYDQQF